MEETAESVWAKKTGQSGRFLTGNHEQYWLDERDKRLLLRTCYDGTALSWEVQILKCSASDCLRTIFLFLLEQHLPVAVVMITAAKEEGDLVHISKVHIKRMLGINGPVRQSVDFQETAVHVWC